MLTDTHPEAERVQIELLRKKTVSERFALVRSLTAFTIDLSRRAIARANPDLSPDELRIKYIELVYGKELSQRVRDYLLK
ncbi:MAG: hypothetical protein ABSA16_10930 [Thermoguttaceae bacterium]|jgi:hypothetical protein